MCHIVNFELLGGCKYKIYNVTKFYIYTHPVNSKFTTWQGVPYPWCLLKQFWRLKLNVIAKFHGSSILDESITRIQYFLNDNSQHCSIFLNPVKKTCIFMYFILISVLMYSIFDQIFSACYDWLRVWHSCTQRLTV